MPFHKSVRTYLLCKNYESSHAKYDYCSSLRVLGLLIALEWNWGLQTDSFTHSVLGGHGPHT
jgi:hypothetical protein